MYHRIGLGDLFMDSLTQKLIDKVKRLATMKEEDPIIVLRIGDSFDSICSDSQYPSLAFEDETNYKIIPDISLSGENNEIYSALREAVVYSVLKDYGNKTIRDAAGKAVIVRSGRDMVDTTKTTGDLTNDQQKFQDLYDQRIEDIKRYMKNGYVM